MRIPQIFRRSGRRLVCLAFVLGGISLSAQDRAPAERSREQWQKVDQIFAAMGVREGATVADIGAGDGFFTSRLSRAVGARGQVYAVDIDDKALERLRRRLQEEQARNVIVIKGTPDNPNLPERALDAALIVNSYHEMTEHQSMLAALRRALKPDGRLVIVEPVSDSKRGRPRADQARDHEIDPEFVLQDARATGFRVVGLEDPFTIRSTNLEWMMVLQLRETAAVTAAAGTERSEGVAGELADPALRISLEEFEKILSAGGVTVVDVREPESYAAGHIPGAISLPLDSVEGAAARLRSLNRPVVTYCS
jgi:predicted methyltransferase